MSRRVWLQGQVRTQQRAGIRGPVGKVWPRWISAGVSAEGGRRWECCMKLCPGDRAEACRGAGRLPGLGLGTQTSEERQASTVLQSWSQGGLLMGRQEWGGQGGGAVLHRARPLAATPFLGGAWAGARQEAKLWNQEGRQKPAVLKSGPRASQDAPEAPGHAAPQGRPSPPGPGAPRPRGRAVGAGAACVRRCCGGSGRRAPQWEQPRAVQQAALPAGRTGASPQDSPRAGSRCARPGAVSLCPPNSPAAASSLLCSKYGRGPHKRPHPSAPQRKTGALASPAVPQGHSSSRLPPHPRPTTLNALEKQTGVHGLRRQESPLCPSSLALLLAQPRPFPGSTRASEAVGIREHEVSWPREAQHPRSSLSWPSLFIQVHPRQACRMLKMVVRVSARWKPCPGHMLRTAELAKEENYCSVESAITCQNE